MAKKVRPNLPWLIGLITGFGLTQLKDELWKQLNAKDNTFDY